MGKIAIVGYKGRMGSLIAKALQDEFLIVGIGRDDKLENYEDIGLVIDFASHQSSVASAEYCLKKNIPIIIGSTGHTEEENEKLEQISKQINLIKKANFSGGISVLENFIERVLDLNPTKFEIIEKHHKDKKDSPSGTALELKEFLRQRFDGEIEIYSIREGEEMGEHTIVVHLKDEKLLIKHNVYSRNVFVDGVVKETRKLLK